MCGFWSRLTSALLMSTFQNGRLGKKDLALNVSYVSPCKESTVVETAGSPSMTTSQHRCKSLLRPANGRVPIVTVSFGGWHEVAVKEVERLVAVLARQSGQDCDAGRRLWARANLPFCCSGEC